MALIPLPFFAVSSLLLAISFAAPSEASLGVPSRLSRKLSLGDSYWFAVGREILDANGQVVKFSGVNWNGMDTGNCSVDGLWNTRNFADYIEEMTFLNLNLVRINFASTCISEFKVPSGINYTSNPELKGLTVMGVLDRIVRECGLQGLKVILSNTRVTPSQPPNYDADVGIWYTSSFPESQWINNWKLLASRYAANPTVIGVDLYNEVHNDPSHPDIVWDKYGAGEPYNWRTAAMRAAAVVLQANPNLLICVQGITSPTSGWGADLSGVATNPIKLTMPYKLVYSVHEYGPRVANYSWFYNATFPANLVDHWDANWGFIFKQDIAPVWVGAWGTVYNATSRKDMERREVKWADALKQYIRANELSWAWYTLGPNVNTTGGILKKNWLYVNKYKVDFLESLMHVFFGPSTGQKTATPPPHGALTVYSSADANGILFNNTINILTPVAPPKPASRAFIHGGSWLLALAACLYALLL